ncbi:MAG: hypothetical protein LBU46_01840 [Candidatus Accumulibacter sp.]|jgi:hypothetical protein|nr:hypothetical protein [Accumulibacter sp.]
MACVIVPAAEAIIVSLILKKMKQREASAASGGGLTWTRKLEWLHKALWGGVFLLVIEHVWHGEITFWPPFLTAMSNPADTEAMLHEMATVGVSMALFITVVWSIAVLVVDRLQQRKPAETAPTR